jgi:hypothetical protein
MSIGRRRIALLGMVGLLTVIGLGTLVEWRPASPAVGGRSPVSGPPVVRRETGATLEPALFRGEAAEAYRVAREIPDVLDQLECYCACGREYGHVSLLSCYVDGHGST